MSQKYGELIPVGGGDPIPLLKKTLLVGRRESNDVVLRFANVSSNHCQLYVKQGYWFVEDQNSRNGTKVNGKRVRDTDKRIDPGSTISIAKHEYELQYDPIELGATGPPPEEVNVAEEILGKSLLERAGIGTSRRRANDQFQLAQRLKTTEAVVMTAAFFMRLRCDRPSGWVHCTA